MASRSSIHDPEKDMISFFVAAGYFMVCVQHSLSSLSLGIYVDFISSKSRLFLTFSQTVHFKISEQLPNVVCPDSVE